MSDENKNTEPEKPSNALNDLNESNDTMEVHKHPHHVTHKKKWGEYLLEFFMLFLAVFLGFLAENMREHQIEKEREKQYIESYIEDLKADTAAIRRNLVFRELKGRQMDSLMSLLSTQSAKGHENDLYYLGRVLIRSKPFQSTDRTIIQLKNSGALRLIRSRLAADSMISYQKLIEIIDGNQNDDRVERRATDPLLTRIFDPFVFDKMVTLDGVNRPVNNPPLRSYDQDLFKDLAYSIHIIKGSNFIIEARLKVLDKKATELIALLKKEYHLENE